MRSLRFGRIPSTDCSSAVRVSMTVRTSAPNPSTNFFARTGPMPFTKPLPRYRSIPATVVGGTVALQSGALERLREFSSPGLLLRTLLLHVARGYSLRETAVRAKLADWVDVSDVALLKRIRKSEEWLHSLCVELLRENGVHRGEEAASPRIRIVDGTIVKEPGRTRSQWRILYSLQLPNLRCDYFDVTATLGEGSGESLSRLSVHPQELILADAGYCSIAGIEHVQRRGA